MKQTLLVLMCLGVLTWTVFAVTGHIRKNCCLFYTLKIPPIRRLKNYKIQEDDGRCDIKAVIFCTVQNRHICADPDDTKVKQLMRKLKVRITQRKKQQRCSCKGGRKALKSRRSGPA